MTKILLLPFTMGVGYEVLMIAGKHDNALTRAISAPGLWVQRITTKEPTLDMLEVAITSIKGALRREYPEYQEFWDRREWEKKEETCEERAEATAEEVSETVQITDTNESATASEAIIETQGETTEVVTEETAPTSDSTDEGAAE